MTLRELPILDAWNALGGDALRVSRGKAFWRSGDGYSVALDPANGTWYDYRDNIGGGVLGLVRTALNCDTGAALAWLEANCGLDPRRGLPAAERRHLQQERADAEHFALAVCALTDEVLEHLSPSDRYRANFTDLLRAVRKGGPELLAWQEDHPELTQALVQTGAASLARTQRRLALYVKELSNVT